MSGFPSLKEKRDGETGILKALKLDGFKVTRFRIWMDGFNSMTRARVEFILNDEQCRAFAALNTPEDRPPCES